MIIRSKRQLRREMGEVDGVQDYRWTKRLCEIMTSQPDFPCTFEELWEAIPYQLLYYIAVGWITELPTVTSEEIDEMIDIFRGESGLDASD